jgi:hypothetical protein
MAHQLKTKQEMFPLVQAWLESGLTQKQFCSNQGMRVHILAYWVGRYHKAQPRKATADKVVAGISKSTKAVVAADSYSGFIRLSPPAPTPTPAPAANQLPAGNMEVVLPTGAIIRFSAILPISYLTQLLSACSH